MISHSENMADLATALVKAQAAFPNIDMDGTGQVGQNRNYKYATLAHIIKTVTPILTANGLSVVQTCEPSAPGSLRVTTTLLHASGQYLEGTLEMPAGSTPQQAGSALTYARRYSLAAILGVAADEDDDGAEASKPRQQRERPAAPRTAPPAPATEQRAPVGVQAASGGYGDMTPTDCTTMGRNWFFAKLRDLGYEHDSAAALLGITSFGADMGDQKFSAILGWVEAAKLKAQKAAI